ncbi:hypothetical protein FJY63_11200, partial [Candidatus Sumerlaeota bacterium]|nr:hypothetical protein [Candidatus Sumerlaeota bacterium]
MRRTFALLVIGLIGPCFVSGPTTAMPATGKPDQIVLLDFSRESDMKAVEARNAKCSKSDSKALRVEIADLKPSAGVAIKAPQGKWDLSRYANIALELKNLGSRP